MKTLLFCTTHINDIYNWKYRYLKWIQAHLNSSLIIDEIILIDDGSKFIPNEEFIEYKSIDKINFRVDKENSNLVKIFSFNDNLGRIDLLNYPGWYRSFQYAIKYGKKNNYEKIIHIESDSYVFSERMINYINELNSDWSVFWCPRWNFPESCIQVICSDSINKAYDFTQQNYSRYVNKRIEEFFPFTKVNHNFIGDRYSEYLYETPLNIDYATQIPCYEPMRLNRNKKNILCVSDISSKNLVNQVIFPESYNTIHYEYININNNYLLGLNIKYSGIQINLNSLNVYNIDLIISLTGLLEDGCILLIVNNFGLNQDINIKLTNSLFSYKIVLAQSILISEKLNYLVYVKDGEDHFILKNKIDNITRLLNY